MGEFNLIKVSKSAYDLKTYKQRERFTKILANEYIICIQKLLVKDELNFENISFPVFRI